MKMNSLLINYIAEGTGQSRSSLQEAELGNIMFDPCCDR